LVEDYAELIDFDPDDETTLKNAMIFYFNSRAEPKAEHLVRSKWDNSLVDPTADVRAAKEFIACMLSKKAFFLYHKRRTGAQYLINRGMCPNPKERRVSVRRNAAGVTLRRPANSGPFDSQDGVLPYINLPPQRPDAVRGEGEDGGESSGVGAHVREGEARCEGGERGRRREGGEGESDDTPRRAQKRRADDADSTRVASGGATTRRMTRLQPRFSNGVARAGASGFGGGGSGLGGSEGESRNGAGEGSGRGEGGRGWRRAGGGAGAEGGEGRPLVEVLTHELRQEYGGWRGFGASYVPNLPDGTEVWRLDGNCSQCGQDRDAVVFAQPLSQGQRKFDVLVHEDHRLHGEGKKIMIASLEKAFSDGACNVVELDVKDRTGAMKSIINSLPPSLMCRQDREVADVWHIERKPRD